MGIVFEIDDSTALSFVVTRHTVNSQKKSNDWG